MDILEVLSFEDVNTWIEEVQNQSPKTILIILVGNKIDLKDKREVTYEEGNDLANKNGIIFMETSAKTGENVNEIFKKSAQEIAKKIESNFYNLNSENCGIVKGDNEDNEMFGGKSNITNDEMLIKRKSNTKGKKGCC